MEINGLTSSTVQTTDVNNYAAQNTNTAAQTETAANTTDVNAAAQNEAAVYEATDKKDTKYQPDIAKIKQMMDDSNRKVESFKKMLEGLIQKQAQKNSVANGWPFQKPQNNQNNQNDPMITIDDETRAAAAKEIEEGGYYSVDETAKRLLDFAVAISGGDPSKISVLKKAVQDGFGGAAEQWGSELPEISQKTYDAVMKGFDEWEKAGSADAITLLNKSNGTAAV